jgi:hypothetical protein
MLIHKITEIHPKDAYGTPDGQTELLGKLGIFTPAPLPSPMAERGYKAGKFIPMDSNFSFEFMAVRLEETDAEA